MGFIHYCAKLVVNFFLHFFWIFPIQKKRITLLNRLSFSYGDNLKYLCESIINSFPGQYEIIFPLKKNTEIPNVKIVITKPFSFKYFRLMLTSSVIITNGVGISYLPIRKKQIVINTLPPQAPRLGAARTRMKTSFQSLSGLHRDDAGGDDSYRPHMSKNTTERRVFANGGLDTLVKGLV